MLSRLPYDERDGAIPARHMASGKVLFRFVIWRAGRCCPDSPYGELVKAEVESWLSSGDSDGWGMMVGLFLISLFFSRKLLAKRLDRPA
ncbi:hypothetical protein F2Q70_00039199 [Brassica cretica]|uniref:Uncharacterized protein n=1 Tax=Brassica cretica TaxID=69181 RepID=A0A8S9MD71_BRACR|nr:hypothetical protein F2Q70_00039199 [Brassica cretica]KAF2618024.1 hypothetical protein F2Q68_00039889 [Brassica cretica]